MEVTTLKKCLFFSLLCCLLFLCGCRSLKKAVPPEDNIQKLNESEDREFGENSQKINDSKPMNSASDRFPEKKVKEDGKGTELEPHLREKPSSKGYTVKVDISEQKVYVYKDGSLIREMICSTGMEGKDTPVGNFKINHRDTWFYSHKFNQGGMYWVGFIGKEYLFHSVPADENGKIIKEEAEKLGTPASHGCVRLSLEDAKWFYETIPDGTDVIIVE